MKRLALVVLVAALLQGPVISAQQRRLAAYDCDPAPLVSIARELIGPEKPRTFPTPTLGSPRQAPGLVAPCNSPETVCAAQDEAKAAAWRADVLRRLRDEVVALERCGY